MPDTVASLEGPDRAKATRRGGRNRKGGASNGREQGIARGLARAGSADGKGDGVMSDTAKILLSVYASNLALGVFLGAVILTSENDTRQLIDEQFEQTRQLISEQFELTRGHAHSPFGQLREELRDLRGDVRALAERVARLEGLLLAAPQTRLVPGAEARGTDSSTARTGDAPAD